MYAISLTYIRTRKACRENTIFRILFQSTTHSRFQLHRDCTNCRLMDTHTNSLIALSPSSLIFSLFSVKYWKDGNGYTHTHTHTHWQGLLWNWKLPHSYLTPRELSTTAFYSGLHCNHRVLIYSCCNLYCHNHRHPLSLEHNRPDQNQWSLHLAFLHYKLFTTFA